MHTLPMVVALCLLASQVQADEVHGTRSEKLVEQRHEATLLVNAGWASLQVRRTVYNGGDRHDQASRSAASRRSGRGEVPAPGGLGAHAFHRFRIALAPLERLHLSAMLWGAMFLRRPALDPNELEPRSTSGYPEPFRSRVLPREKRALGDALGLTKIGVNLTTLPPGKESSMRHFHTREDELVFVLEGEVVLCTDTGEQLLTVGTCAGFAAGSKDGHQLVNRSDRPVRYLEISNRDLQDTAEYPDVDLALHREPDGKFIFARKDGTRY